MAKKGKKGFKISNLSALRKKYDGSGSANEILVDPESILWIPSRILAINEQWGGGAAYGKIIEIYGEESSGKSLLATDFAYSTIALGGKVLWADGEFSFTKSWASANGLDLDHVEILQDKGIETISDWSYEMGLYTRSQLTNNEPILLVVDSLASLDCMENLEASQVDAKAEMGNRAKAIDKWLRVRQRTYEQLGITVILINQLRAKMGASPFEDPDTTPGGRATKFYASIRIGVYGGKTLKLKYNKKEHRVGKYTSIRVKKNKVHPPKETLSKIEVYFKENPKFPIGFNRYFGLADILIDKEAITKKGSRFYLKDKMIANGADNFAAALYEDDELRKKLIRKSGINTISRTKKLLESITENRYPISAVEEDEE